MNEQSAIAEARARPLRILEIGGYDFFASAVPQQTELLWSSMKLPPPGVSALGPLKLIRALMRLRRGAFDLVVIHAPQYAPWHPRSFLMTLRDWHVRAPLGLFANFASRLIHWFHRVPVAAIDLSDSCLIGRHNFSLLRACAAFFKRELPSDHWLVFCKSGYPNFPGRRWRSKPRNVALVGKLRPINCDVPSLRYGNLSLPVEPPAPMKKTDIFFVGAVHGNSTVRAAGLEELRQLQRDGYVIDLPTERLAPPQFFKRMSEAWLAWSPAGLGWDCGRHYEAPLAGTVPLINYPSILWDAPLRDSEHCVFYSLEPSGLARAARQALADKPRLRDMARAASEHVATHHTLGARAERVTSLVLGRRLDGTKAHR
jgi:hypothetical protein